MSRFEINPDTREPFVQEPLMNPDGISGNAAQTSGARENVAPLDLDMPPAANRNDRGGLGGALSVRAAGFQLRRRCD